MLSVWETDEYLKRELRKLLPDGIYKARDADYIDSCLRRAKDSMRIPYYKVLDLWYQIITKPRR